MGEEGAVGSRLVVDRVVFDGGPPGRLVPQGDRIRRVGPEPHRSEGVPHERRDWLGLRRHLADVCARARYRLMLPIQPDVKIDLVIAVLLAIDRWARQAAAEVVDPDYSPMTVWG